MKTRFATDTRFAPVSHTVSPESEATSRFHNLNARRENKGMALLTRVEFDARQAASDARAVAERGNEAQPSAFALWG